jgi:hypothetical protein
MQHDGYKKSPHGNESKYACGQAQISRGPLENSSLLPHHEADDENSDRKVDDGVEDFDGGCQHYGGIICSRNVACPLDFVRDSGIKTAESEECGVIRPCNSEV